MIHFDAVWLTTEYSNWLNKYQWTTSITHSFSHWCCLLIFVHKGMIYVNIKNYINTFFNYDFTRTSKVIFSSILLYYLLFWIMCGYREKEKASHLGQNLVLASTGKRWSEEVRSILLCCVKKMFLTGEFLPHQHLSRLSTWLSRWYPLLRHLLVPLDLTVLNHFYFSNF